MDRLDVIRVTGPKVNNKRLLRRLAFRTVKTSPGKSLVVILAIALCTFMFTTLFSIGGSLLTLFKESTERQVGTSADGCFKYLNDEEYEHVASDGWLKEVSMNIVLGEAVNPELSKRYTEVHYHDEVDAKKGFCYPRAGHLPEKEDEIVVSSLILQDFGFNARNPEEYEKFLGEKLTLQISGKDGVTESTFTVSGIYTGERVSMAQLVLVSKAYQEKYAPTPKDSYYDKENRVFEDVYGRINADVDLYIPLDVAGQLESAAERDGLPIGVSVGVNWASIWGDPDPTTMTLSVCLMITFFLSGYLIINNIYRINVITDIRSYGLLKTVGTGSGQIKKLVRWQANYHSIPGIALGLVTGCAAGSLLLPLTTRLLNTPGAAEHGIDINIWIILFSALFAFLTVRFSIRRAIRIALRVTPMEAVRYTPKSARKKSRHSNSTFSTRGFALRNIFSDRKRFVLVIVSMALSLAALNSVNTLIGGFSADSYVSKFLISDFAVANETTDKGSLRGKTYDGVSDTLAEEVGRLDGVKETGRIYVATSVFQTLNPRDYTRFYDRLLSNELAEKRIRNTVMYNDSGVLRPVDRETLVNCFGMDDLAAGKLEIIKGTYDAEKFRTGRYIIVNESVFTNGDEPIAYFLPGETIAVNTSDGSVREYEVMATCIVPTAIGTRFYADMGAEYILPADEFLDLFGERTAMRLLIEAEDEAEPQIEEWLKDYTSNVDPTLVYTSRGTFKEEFGSLVNMFLAAGGVLTGILALVGLLNFVNTIVSSVMSRRVEYAMLEAVGMTKKAQRRSICIEGAVYAGFSIVAGTLLGALISVLLIRPFSDVMWFATYDFTLTPIFFMIPVMLTLMLAIPFVIYKRVMRESVVERIRAVNI